MALDTPADQTEFDDAELKALLAMMTDAQRAAIVRALGARPGMGSTELASRLDLPPATVRKQLRALMELGMVHVQKREVRRGVQKLYFAHTQRNWITEDKDPKLSRRQRQTVDLEILRCIVADARRAIAAPDYGERSGRMVASETGAVDARTWQELSGLQHEMLERMAEIIDTGRARLVENDQEEPVSLVTALLLLELPGRADAD